MADDLLQPLLDALTTTIGAPVRTLGAAPADVRRAALRAASLDDGVAEISLGIDRYLALQYHRHRTAILVLGPYRRDTDPAGEAPVLDGASERRARAALETAARGFAGLVDDRRERLELASRLELITSAAIAITSELSLDRVLRRIVDLAREIVGARYAALGVVNDLGRISPFLTAGITPEEEAKIGEPPCGHGILGLLMRKQRIIRLADLRDHPAAVGFPPHHPVMRSFLGVPIIGHGRVLGNLYLTEKRFADEFTEEDEHIVELLSRYAAVAIENAELYQDIQRQQRRLQAIIDQSPEAVVIAQPNPERLTLANSTASRLLGWNIEPPIPIQEFVDANPRFSPDNAPIDADRIPILQSLRHGEVVRREVRLLRPDGRLLTVLVNSSPILDEDGKIAAAVAVFQDISEIKDAEQLKDDFLSLVSHELRTPMTTIQGGALVLLQDGDALEPAVRRELLTDIATESRRLADLVENMVQLANIRAGRLNMETEPIHVRALVDTAVRATLDAAPDHRFDVAIERDLLALGDPSRVDQVIRNLLHNAVKYAPRATTVEISGCRRDDMVVISVRDHGPGIAEEDLPFVFERFRRGAQVTHRSTAGMGLGLYLSKHLVEAHGGKIWIERPSDGGTMIRFSLPAVPPED